MRRVSLILLIGLLVRLYWGPITRNTEYSELEALMPQPERPRGLSTGTGFYVSTSGELITADHVVRNCRRIEVASQSVKPIDARIVHASRELDLALLRTDWRPEAILRFAGPAKSALDFTLVGYPAGGSTLSPTTAALRLVNGRVHGRPPVDPEMLLYLDGPVKHGNSGGPILDTDGNAVGVILRLADRQTAKLKFGIDVAELGLGEGLQVVRAFLQEARYFPPHARVAERVSTSADAARAAIVRVFCWQ